MSAAETVLLLVVGFLAPGVAIRSCRKARKALGA